MQDDADRLNQAQLDAYHHGNVGYISNVSGWDEGNLRHAAGCRWVPRMTAAGDYRKYFDATREASARRLDRLCGAGHWHDCAYCMG